MRWRCVRGRNASLDDFVRAKLEEIAGPAGTAASAAAAGVEINNGEAQRKDSNDSEDENYAPVLTTAEADALIRRAIYEAMVRAGFRIRRSERLLH